MLSINFSDVIWTIIDFFLLFFVLKRLLFRPLLDFMEKRDERIARGEMAVRDAEERVEAQRLASQSSQEENRRLAREIIESSAAEDIRRQQQASLKLHENAEKQRQQTEESIRKDCRDCRDKLSGSSDRLAQMLSDTLTGSDA